MKIHHGLNLNPTFLNEAAYFLNIFVVFNLFSFEEIMVISVNIKTQNDYTLNKSRK